LTKKSHTLSHATILSCWKATISTYASTFLTFLSRGAQSGKGNPESEAKNLSEEEWKQINQLIGYKEDMESPFFPSQGKLNMLHTLLDVHMRHNASKLTIDGHDITELSSEGFQCSVKLYPETKIFDIKLQSYQLNAPEGLLLEVVLSVNKFDLQLYSILYCFLCLYDYIFPMETIPIVMEISTSIALYAECNRR